jgi:hypothetical protein
MIERLHARRSIYMNRCINLYYRALLKKVYSINWIHRLIHIFSTDKQNNEGQISFENQNQGNGNPRPPKKPGNIKKPQIRGGR